SDYRERASRAPSVKPLKRASEFPERIIGEVLRALVLALDESNGSTSTLDSAPRQEDRRAGGMREVGREAGDAVAPMAMRCASLRAAGRRRADVASATSPTVIAGGG